MKEKDETVQADPKPQKEIEKDDTTAGTHPQDEADVPVETHPHQKAAVTAKRSSHNHNSHNR